MSASPPSPPKALALGWVNVACTVAILSVYLAWFNGYERSGVQNYTSDVAVTMLMANSAKLSANHLYFFGVDRFGGWPYIVMNVVARVFDGWWSPTGLLAARTSWVCTAMIWIVALTRRRQAAMLWAVASMFIVVPAFGWLLDASQLYGWQLPAIFWAWWSLRKGCEGVLDPQAPSRRAVPRAAGWLVIAAIPALAAMWMSIVGVGYIGVAAVAEFLRAAFLYRPKGWRLALAAFMAFAPVAVAAAAAKLIFQYHHLHASPVSSIDFGVGFDHMPQKLGAIWAIYCRNRLLCRPVVVATILVASVGTWRVARFAWKNRGTSADDGHARRASGELDLIVLALGCAALAACTIAAAVSSRYLQWNYGPLGQPPDNARYLLVADIFCWLSLAGFAVASLRQAYTLHAPFLHRRWVPSAALAFLMATFYQTGNAPSNGVEVLADHARAIEARLPGGYLLGNYWSTYSLASMQHAHGLVPVVADGLGAQYTPFDWVGFRNAPEIVVSHLKNDGTSWLARYAGAANPRPAIPDTDFQFGTPDSPSPEIRDQGAVFRFKEHIYAPETHEMLPYSVYENVAVADRTGKAELAKPRPADKF